MSTRSKALLVVCVLLVASGLFWFFHSSPDEADEQAAMSPAAAGVQVEPTDERDVLAARPMPTYRRSATFPAPVVEPAPAQITVPGGDGVDPYGVATGITEQTPEAAVGQLAAMWRAAWSMASVPHATELIDRWSVPGAARNVESTAVKDLMRLLDTLGYPHESRTTVAMTWTPRMAQIKGTVGDDFVVACVMGHLQVTPGGLRTSPAGTCQRMGYVDGRWVIAPGAEPVRPPLSWPLTQVAYDQGWSQMIFAEDR